jgi:hypothetical protein
MTKTTSASGFKNIILYSHELLDNHQGKVCLKSFRENIISHGQLRYANSVSYFDGEVYARLK